MIFSRTVDAVMDGSKTQTRRPKKEFDEIRTTDDGIKYVYNTQMQRVRYCVDRTYSIQPGRGKRGIGRMKILGLRFENLMDVDTDGAMAEGIMADEINGPPSLAFFWGFLREWMRLYENTEYDVSENPEVVVITFARVE